MCMTEAIALLSPILLISVTLWTASMVSVGQSKQSSSTTYNGNNNTTTIAELGMPLCPKQFSNGHCSFYNISVMSGIDFVPYFDTTDGIDHNEQYGHSNITATYTNYTFEFKNQLNRLAFESNPTQYAPQYGGFCAWAVGGETDPAHHPWSENCLGPPGDPSIWTLFRNRLYFFRYQEAKDNFLSNPDLFSKVGDERWFGWFAERGVHSPFNTLCSKIYISSIL